MLRGFAVACFILAAFQAGPRGCTTSTCTSSPGANLSEPYAGMGFGYAF